MLHFFGEKFGHLENYTYLCSAKNEMVSIAQLVRASDCGSEGRGFDPHCSPIERGFAKREASLLLYMREMGCIFL